LLFQTPTLFHHHRPQPLKTITKTLPFAKTTYQYPGPEALPVINLIQPLTSLSRYHSLPLRSYEPAKEQPTDTRSPRNEIDSANETRKDHRVLAGEIRPDLQPGTHTSGASLEPGSGSRSRFRSRFLAMVLVQYPSSWRRDQSQLAGSEIFVAVDPGKVAHDRVEASSKKCRNSVQIR
jgi:hypothetical protein